MARRKRPTPDALRDAWQSQPSLVASDNGRGLNYQLCRTMLQVSVPWRILQFQERGGVTAEDFARVATYNDILAGEEGVYLLFRSPKPGVTARMFNLVSDAIAVLSYAPGGITIFDDHYETLPPPPQVSSPT